MLRPLNSSKRSDVAGSEAETDGSRGIYRPRRDAIRVNGENVRGIGRVYAGTCRGGEAIVNSGLTVLPGQINVNPTAGEFRG